jgi:thermitase
LLAERFGDLVPEQRLRNEQSNVVASPINRAIFENAGWVFVGLNQEMLLPAASKRTNFDCAVAVRPILINRSGDIFIVTALVTVQLQPDKTEEEISLILREQGLTLVRQLRFARNTFEARLPTGVPLTEIIPRLQENSNIYRFAEPTLLEVIPGRSKPEDPEYDRQWQHYNDGSNGGMSGADIRSENAWELTRGRNKERPMRIAVIDNGMQIDHPDLKDGIIGGGYFSSDNQETTTFVRFKPGMTDFPDSDHGTFCLGMAGARMNNGHGGCGSAPEADLLAIACLGDQVGTQTTLARAIAYAADPTMEVAQSNAADGADVISCSLGSEDADWDLTAVLREAIEFAAAKGRNGQGTPIFWAVSNGDYEIVRDQVCSHQDVIAVGRSNRNDVADGSAFGPKLDFLAPGADVYSTSSESQYVFDTGTSYAAPLAAGVGALVLALRPNISRAELLNRLRAGCDKIGGVTYDANGHHTEYGFGRINAEKSVK